MFRTRLARALLVVATLVSSIAALASVPSSQTSPTVVLRQALDAYEKSPDGTMASRLVKQGAFVELLRRYPDEAKRWISEARPDQKARKERVAAGLAIEMVAVAVDSFLAVYAQSKPLVEWACELLAKSAPSEFERQLHLASLAALQGAGDYALFGYVDDPKRKPAHIDYSKRRFPDEDRLKLAEVVARHELRVISTGPLSPFDLLPALGSMVVAGGRAGASDQAITARASGVNRISDTLGRLTALGGPLVRDEARLRRGVLQLVTGKVGEATQDLGISAVSEDPFVAYLANVLLGSIYYTTGETSAAVARYSRAAHIMPATSARLGLAAALLKQGSAREAADLTATMLGERRGEDPWRLYGLGLFHTLPKHLAAMRAEIR